MKQNLLGAVVYLPSDIRMFIMPAARNFTTEISPVSSLVIVVLGSVAIDILLSLAGIRSIS